MLRIAVDFLRPFCETLRPSVWCCGLIAHEVTMQRKTGSPSKRCVDSARSGMFPRIADLWRYVVGDVLKCGSSCTRPDVRAIGRFLRTSAAWGCLAIGIICCLGLFGCATDKPAEPPPDDSMRAFIRQARPQKSGDIECKGFSDRANEIESDLGAK
jgi:hypothetical protein